MDENIREEFAKLGERMAGVETELRMMREAPQALHCKIHEKRLDNIEKTLASVVVAGVGAVVAVLVKFALAKASGA